MSATEATPAGQFSRDEPVNVRVSTRKRKFLYVDFAKHRLHEGIPEVIISGLGSAITDAVSVAEMLKNKNLVVVKKIRTSRGDVEGSRSSYVDKIEITVTKSADFDAIYAEQERARESRQGDAKEDEDEDE